MLDCYLSFAIFFESYLNVQEAFETVAQINETLKNRNSMVHF